jgi:hypothetical protein
MELSGSGLGEARDPVILTLYFTPLTIAFFSVQKCSPSEKFLKRFEKNEELEMEDVTEKN